MGLGANPNGSTMLCCSKVVKDSGLSNQQAGVQLTHTAPIMNSYSVTAARHSYKVVAVVQLHL